MTSNTITTKPEPTCWVCSHGTLAHNAIGSACTICDCDRFRAADPVPAREGQIAALVGRLVEDVCDDGPCPLVGLVVGQVDEDTLEVLWGDRRFEENPGPGNYEPFDALRPARDGAR